MMAFRYIKVHSATRPRNRSRQWWCKALEQVLSDDEQRENLVRELLKSHAQLQKLIELRFVNAVSQYEQTQDPEEKLRKGTCIYQVFLSQDARYRLEMMNPDIESNLSTNFNRTVIQLKKQILARLAVDDAIATFLYDHAATTTTSPNAANERRGLSHSRCIMS